MVIEQQDVEVRFKGTDSTGPARRSAEQNIRSLADVAKSFGPIIAGAFSGVAAMAALQIAEMVKVGAAAEQRAKGFEQLARSHGVLADQVVRDLARVSGDTIATTALMEKAGTAMLMGIPADKLTGLMEIARASSRITGQEVTKSFEDIALAVARGSRMILDNLGIIISEEKAYKDFAASVGKSASELTDAEKKQAFMNATLLAGQDIVRRVGLETVDAAESMQQYTANVQDLKEAFGGLFIGDTLVNGIGSVAESVNGLNWLLRDTRDLLDEIETSMPKPGSPEGRWAFSPSRIAMSTLLGPAGNMGALLGVYGAMRESQEGSGPERFPFPGRFNAATGRYEPWKTQEDPSPVVPPPGAPKPRRTPASFFQDAANWAYAEVEFEDIMNYRPSFTPFQNFARPDGKKSLGYDDFDMAKHMSNLEERGNFFSMFAPPRDQLETEFEGQRSVLTDWLDRGVITRQEYADAEITLVRDKAEAITEIERSEAIRRWEIENQTNQLKLAAFGQYASAAGQLFESANTLFRGKMKTLFIASRAAAAAGAIIHGHQAGMAAVAPPPLGLGPVFGPPLKALMIAGGYTNAAAIMAQAFESGGGGGRGGGGEGGGGYGPGAPFGSGGGSAGVVAQPQQTPQGPQQINLVVHVNGSIVGSNLQAWMENEFAPVFREAVGRNVDMGITVKG